MKDILNKFPTGLSFSLAILLFGLTLVIGGLINNGVIKQYFPYIPCILLFVVTWFLFKRDKESSHLIELNIRNILFLPLGTLIGASAFLGARLLRALYLGESVEVSTSISNSVILSAFYFILPQVATEELLFRGYLFNKMIKASNVIIANIIFSIVFMLIHVLDKEVMSNMGMVLMLGITIPVGHILFATALLKSKTLYFPIGIHLGNNWATRHLISVSNEGDSFLYITNTTTFETWTPFIISILLVNSIMLLTTLLIWKWNKVLEVLNDYL